MIGIGTWTGKVHTMFFSGDITFTIGEKDGSYDFSIHMPQGGSSKLPEFQIKEVREEVNSLLATAEVSLLPGKTVDIKLTFDGDKMNGSLKIPFIGKIDLKNFTKI